MSLQPDLSAVLEAVRVVSPSANSAFHGDDHWRRVATNGLDLAAEVGADPLLVVLFAIFHDSMRYDDGPVEGHGLRGADLACRLNEEFLGLPDDRLHLLDLACKGHTKGTTSEDPTIGACWDADRLDLCRLGMPIHPDAISTAPGRTTAVQERARALLAATPEWPSIFERLRNTGPEPLERRDYDAAALMRQHPPVLRNENKKVIFGIACPDSTAGGHISYSRWAEMALPATTDPSRAASLLQVRDGFFDYQPVAADPGPAAPAVEWHLNFADPNLFFAYGWAMFAQDEIQAAEHPVLGSLREALVAGGRPTRTVEGGRPTPALVMGAERRVRIQTDRRAERGGPSWLYGIAFAEASPEVVRKATTRIDPPTISNIIAIAAPIGGYGRYRKDQIELALATAYSGFRAAVLESRRAAGPDVRAIVHSGFWGCGAFGGNRVMMTLLQLLAAEMAGVDGLVLHVGDPAGRAPVEQATGLLQDDLAADGPIDTGELIDRIEALGLEWGHSDGN